MRVTAISKANCVASERASERVGESEGRSPSVILVWLVSALCGSACMTAAQSIGPVIVVETSRGRFSFETFPNDAPLTVAHVVALVTSGFYDGQRVHRAVPGFVVQFGDPQTRDPSTRQLWGRGAAAASGKPIGAAEITRRRIHVKGAVAMAHIGDPAKADSQLYVTLANRPDLDGQYAVFGQVTDGEEVVESLQVGDLIARVSVKP